MAARKRRKEAGRRRTKIVCTIGPATWTRKAIEGLARAGMDVARVNFSYGTQAEHARTIGNVRAVARRLGRPIGILQDLAGPKLRVGEVPGGEVALRRGEEVVLSAARSPEAPRIAIPLAELPGLVSAGERLLLGDGRIGLKVVETTDREIRCRVQAGGVLRSHQGVAAPDTRLPIRVVRRKDLADLRFGLEQGVDWVAMSFVRGARDLAPLRRAMRRAGRSAGVMAKIERHEAIDHLEEIVEAADGMMVARGDLGIQMALDRVPVLQKEIIARGNGAGKPVVTATQMLESMVNSPRPTRAEVSDVANAVLDGTDAVMLSGETAVGRYPREAVEVMARVAGRAEAAFDFAGRLQESSQWPCETVTDGISQATVNLAHDLEARAIITATNSGHTALMVAMYRPEAPIVAVTPDVATERRLTLAWGVRPLLAPRGKNTDELMVNAVARAREARLVRDGDLVVITAGVPAAAPRRRAPRRRAPGRTAPGRTNLIRVEVVGRSGQL